MILNEIGIPIFVSEQMVMPNHGHLILAQYDKRKIANCIGLIGYGTMNRKRMIQGDGIMHDVGTCYGMSLHATDDADVWTRHGESPPSGVSKIANQFGKHVSGSVPVVINPYNVTVKRLCNKNDRKFFQWQSRF